MFRAALASLLIVVSLAFVAGCEAQAPARPRNAAPAPRAKTKVIYAFTASWCGPCKRNEPKLREIESKGVNVRRIDIDREPEMARKFGISSVPTYVVMEDGREINRTQNIAVLVRILKVIKWLLLG